MVSIEKEDDVGNLKDGNQILGRFPKLSRSSIQFQGKNNILFCEENVCLNGSNITFNGDNSIIYLSANKNSYLLGVETHNNNTFYFGKNAYINGKLMAILSERKNIIIGDECMFSLGIWMRNADPHLVYRCATGQRINHSKSIYVGDHVWIGQNCLILKGVEIDSGSIVGGGAVVAGKKIPNNEVWGGNPAKRIGEGVFWDGSCVHSWNEGLTELSKDYSSYVNARGLNIPIDNWIYRYEASEELKFSTIEEKLQGCHSGQDKLVVLKEYLCNRSHKNRFVHK